MTMWLVRLPGRAEAQYLAGIAPVWPKAPASPEAEAVAAVQAWLSELASCGCKTVPVGKVTAELGAILGKAAPPERARPVCGPFAPGRRGAALQGRVEWVHGSVVRLDDDAVSSLKTLRDGEDFRVAWYGDALVMWSGGDRCLLVEERYPEK